MDGHHGTLRHAKDGRNFRTVSLRYKVAKVGLDNFTADIENFARSGFVEYPPKTTNISTASNSSPPPPSLPMLGWSRVGEGCGTMDCLSLLLFFKLVSVSMRFSLSLHPPVCTCLGQWVCACRCVHHRTSTNMLVKTRTGCLCKRGSLLVDWARVAAPLAIARQPRRTCANSVHLRTTEGGPSAPAVPQCCQTPFPTSH